MRHAALLVITCLAPIGGGVARVMTSIGPADRP